MDKTEGMITENCGDYKVEKMLFTYNENEMQENRFNKFVVEQERKGWSYFVIEQQQLALGFSEAEAIMFNFIDGYTKSGKYFWYSTQDICEKTYWGKDKVINTIKSLVKKGYVIREKGKDRFGNERRFLSTTTKYSLELLKLRGVSENQIGGIGKSDRGVSEKPTHSIIYSNINSNNNNTKNQNQEQPQEQPQDTNVSIPKQKDSNTHTKTSELDFIKNSDDIRDIFDDDEIAQHKIQLKIILKMVELGYKVKKSKSDIEKEFERLKAKAKLYGLIQGNGDIAWTTFYQKIDKRYDWHIENGKKVKNFKTSIIPFISK